MNLSDFPLLYAGLYLLATYVHKPIANYALWQPILIDIQRKLHIIYICSKSSFNVDAISLKLAYNIREKERTHEDDLFLQIISTTRYVIN